MSSVEPGSRAEHMLNRAKELILRPDETWDVIDGEEATIEGLYRGWVLPLAAVPAICSALGHLAFGRFQIFGVRFHPSVIGIATQAATSYALTLVGVYVMALVVDELALRFGGERSRTQAFKLSAYSASVGWLGGIFLLLPTPGGVLAVLAGLYGLYVFYKGLPKLMRSDPEQTLTYFALTLLVLIGLTVLFGILTSCVGSWGGPVSIY
ncbi:MAG: Yip1 family protein [Phenylobacterium sp.]